MDFPCSRAVASMTWMITHFHRQFPIIHFPHFFSNQTCTLFESNFTLSNFNRPQKLKFGNFVYQIDCFMPFQFLDIFVGTFRATFDPLLLCYCDIFYSTLTHCTYFDIIWVYSFDVHVCECVFTHMCVHVSVFKFMKVNVLGHASVCMCIWGPNLM